MTDHSDFDELIADADRQPFRGWDFSYLHGRMHEESVDWNYTNLVRTRLSRVDAVLDMGTGGGELLSSLAPLPVRTVATEAYTPNVQIARARLAPLGVEVVAIEKSAANVEMAQGEGAGTLPFPNESFPLVINRHESYYPAEVRRILQPGGSFITQQVGGSHNVELNRLLGEEPAGGTEWNLAFAVQQLEKVRLHTTDKREVFPETAFSDIGAVVYYLKAVPWQIPNFTAEQYRDRLLTIHQRILRDGALRIRGHFFFLESTKPRRDDLHRFLTPDGKVVSWPSKPKYRQLVLAYLADQFEESRTYSETEVNEILQHWHTWRDPAFLRRTLFDEGLIDRTADGSRYWRTGA